MKLAGLMGLARQAMPLTTSVLVEMVTKEQKLVAAARVHLMAALAHRAMVALAATEARTQSSVRRLLTAVAAAVAMATRVALAVLEVAVLAGDSARREATAPMALAAVAVAVTG
jgi:hypothetical protein